jgi:hypothetical protein
MSIGAAAPAMAPMPGMGGGMGGGPVEEAATEAAMYAGAAEAEEATEAPAATEGSRDMGDVLATPTPDAAILQAPAPTALANAEPEMDTQAFDQPTVLSQQKLPALSPWPFLWLGLAFLLAGLALLLRWGRDRQFARRAKRK